MCSCLFFCKKNKSASDPNLTQIHSRCVYRYAQETSGYDPDHSSWCLQLQFIVYLTETELHCIWDPKYGSFVPSKIENINSFAAFKNQIKK